MAQTADTITRPSSFPVPEALDRIRKMLESRQITIFATFDHSGEAKKAGLEMRPTQVLVFGSPRGGTPLMVAFPTLALDLPLKALLWEDAAGKTWLTYHPAQTLIDRYGLTEDQVKGLASLLKAVEETVA